MEGVTAGMKLRDLKEMKGDVGPDILIKLGLGIIVAGVILIFISPLIQDASQQAQSCGAFRNWITDLSSGNAELC